jgi:hypothetical protein
MKLIKRLSLLSVIALSTMGLIACSEDDSPTEPAPVGQGMVMAVHTSPDAPAVDILVDDVVAKEALTFPQNTGYVGVTAGTRNVKVNVSGTDPVVNVFNANLPIAANANYSIFAIDSLASLDFLALIDDLSSPTAGNSHVRFIHLSPNAPGVNITDTDGNIIFEDYEFGENSDFTPIPAGSYDLQVRLASDNETVVLSLPGIALGDGKIYTVFAKGFVGGEGDQALGAEIIVNK